jgi:hypothetical protein
MHDYKIPITNRNGSIDRGFWCWIPLFIESNSRGTHTMASAYAAQAVPGQQYPGGGPQAPPPGSAAGGGAGGPPVPDSYFTESRKGEISELRNLLRGFAAERDPARKRDIIKKVIAYMTLGIDVSRLFSDMMLAIETRCVAIGTCISSHHVWRKNRLSDDCLRLSLKSVTP